VTVTVTQLLLYAGALLILFLTPGPVWVALIARAMSGGFAQARPLAVGVTIGDVLWPLLAILGMSWVLSQWGEALTALKWVAAGIFLWMGWALIRHADRALSSDSRLVQPGRMAGFLAGVAVIIGNPKAILFYMGVLPGFFDLRTVTAADIVVICAMSMAIPLVGNLALSVALDRARRLLSSAEARTRVNRVSGALLIVVGVILPWV
jgi:threonine/homoserine/homoserine lactone efflux protein